MIFVCLFVVLIWIGIKNFKVKKKCLPPGPWKLPLIGNLLNMAYFPHLRLFSWAEKYGPLYTIYFGGTPTIVINDFVTMKKLMGMMAATGRLECEITTMLANGKHGIAHTDGSSWLEQKSFSLQTFRKFGLGRSSCMEPLILEEAENCFTLLDKSCLKKEPAYVSYMLKMSTIRILWKIVAGNSMPSDELLHASTLVKNVMGSFAIAVQSGLMFFPWIKYFAPKSSGYNSCKRGCKTMYEFIEDIFAKHASSRNVDQPSRNVIDAYIDKVTNCTDTSSSFYGENGWKNAQSSVGGFLFAGGESVGIVLNWLLFYMSVYPEEQKKVQQEIDQVILSDEIPSLSHRPRMQYMEAVILETFRFASMAPFGGLHAALEDISFDGYVIPKGTQLLTNLYYVQHNKNTWGDPEIFRPERFLDNGKSLKEFVIPFQVGRRSCPGEAIARDEIFLFATLLLRRYTFSPDAAVKDPKLYLEPDASFGLLPKPFGVMLSFRK